MIARDRSPVARGSIASGTCFAEANEASFQDQRGGSFLAPGLRSLRSSLRIAAARFPAESAATVCFSDASRLLPPID